MTVTQTSMDAWIKLQENNRVSINHKIILDVFKSLNGQYISNYDLKNILGWDVNRITPRVNELKKMGYLVHSGFKTQLETNRKVMIYCMPIDYKGWVTVLFNKNKLL